MKATCGTIRVDVPNSTEASDSAWSENNEIIGMSRGFGMDSRLGACWVGGVSTPGTAQSTNYCCCHVFLLWHCSNANAPFCIHSWRVPPAAGQLWVKVVVQRVRLQAVQVHSNNCSQIKVFPYLCMYSWGAQKVGNNLAHFMQIMPALHFFLAFPPRQLLETW